MLDTKDETLTGLLKEKFKLMNKRSEIRTRIHFCITVGDHDGTEKNAKLLKVVEKNLEAIDLKLSDYDNTQDLQRL